MSLFRWFEANLEYARKLATSGLQGAGHGREEFLHQEPVVPFLAEAARQALAPAALGACLGRLGSYFATRDVRGNRKPANRRLAITLLGGMIGFGAGLVWNTQGLAAHVARRGFEHTRSVRDQRWLQRHPINYA